MVLCLVHCGPALLEGTVDEGATRLYPAVRCEIWVASGHSWHMWGSEAVDAHLGRMRRSLGCRCDLVTHARGFNVSVRTCYTCRG
jgi:hypothetical protein